MSTSPSCYSSYKSLQLPEDLSGNGDHAHIDDKAKVQTKKGSSCSMIYFVVYVLCFLILACSIAFNALVFVQLTQVKSELNKLRPGCNVTKSVELCVSCDIFAYSASEASYLLRNFSVTDEREDGKKCCVNATGVKELIQRGVQRQLLREKAKGTFGETQHIIIHQKDGKNYTSWNKPVAHLLGTPQPDISTAPGEPQSIRAWLTPDRHQKTLLRNGLSYRDGRIIISTEGLYYIYSQIYFIELYTDKSTVFLGEVTHMSHAQRRTHFVFRYNINEYANGGEDQLLQGKATKCWGQKKQYEEFTSYLGGVFHLRRGDEIFVKVSNVSEISRLALSNNFGLYML